MLFIIDSIRVIYYRMDKYSGCNIVESVVTPVKRDAPKKRASTYFIVRMVIAVVIVGFILAVHYLNLPWLEPVKKALHAVFCFDAFGREAGASAFFG